MLAAYTTSRATLTVTRVIVERVTMAALRTASTCSSALEAKPRGWPYVKTIRRRVGKTPPPSRWRYKRASSALAFMMLMEVRSDCHLRAGRGSKTVRRFNDTGKTSRWYLHKHSRRQTGGIRRVVTTSSVEKSGGCTSEDGYCSIIDAAP